jgi:GGDEF domain-containing protein
MSLRVKFIAALLVTSLLSVAIVGIVAQQRLMRKFDGLVLARAARNFSGDVAAYWLTYGSFEAGLRIEPFRHFSLRRRVLLGQSELAPRMTGPSGQGPDTGGPGTAEALPPWSPHDAGPEGPPSPPDFAPNPRDPGRGVPPFLFVLFDPSGKILSPPPETGRALRPKEQQNAIPITVQGRIVAFASPLGITNYSVADRAYITAVRDAIGWGIAAAALTAIGLGLVVGNRLSASLRKLTGAIRNMQQGSLRQQVDIASRDEVGILARTFNAMSDELAESHERLQALHRTVSEQAEQLREQAIRDSLTGLHNRRCFDERAASAYQHAIRHGQPMAVAIGDIDHFKSINDRFSHAVGDAVLREVGNLLRLHLRSSDLAARYGGEDSYSGFPRPGWSRPPNAANGCARSSRRIPGNKSVPSLRSPSASASPPTCRWAEPRPCSPRPTIISTPPSSTAAIASAVPRRIWTPRRGAIQRDRRRASTASTSGGGYWVFPAFLVSPGFARLLAADATALLRLPPAPFVGFASAGLAFAGLAFPLAFALRPAFSAFFAAFFSSLAFSRNFSARASARFFLRFFSQDAHLQPIGFRYSLK